MSAPVVVALALAVAGVRLWSWLPPLRSASYRYPEERDLRAIATGWFAPVALGVSIALAWAWTARPGFALVLAVISVELIALALIDWDVYRLPNAITYPLVLITGTGLSVAAWVDGDRGAWGRALLAGLVLGALYLIFTLLPGGGMGRGDAKLAPTLGMLLGYLGWEQVLAGTFLAFFSGAAWAAVLLLRGRANRSTPLAFGPHMIIAALAVLIVAGLDTRLALP